MNDDNHDDQQQNKEEVDEYQEYKGVNHRSDSEGTEDKIILMVTRT